MPLPDVKVRLVMGGGDLEDAGAKLDIDVIISHNQQLFLVFLRQRPHRMFTDQMPVTRILRVYRNTAVARNGLGPRGRDLKPGIRLLHNLHLEVVELAVLLLHDDLLIRKRSQRFGAPVHHPLAAINQPLFVEVHKHALHAFRVILIHREAQARPIAASPQLL